MTLYFAYGSNMDPAQMARRCAGAVPLGPALLRDHHLTFTWDSPTWLGGVGHVEPAPGEHVWGVLWDLTAEHIGSLDGYEQVADGVYSRVTRTVEHRGERVDAVVYVATASGFKRPSRRYMRALIRGAEHFGLPPDYVQRLRALA